MADKTMVPASSTNSQQDDQWLPVLDVGPYLAGEPGALEALAAELRKACEGVGFYFLENTSALLPERVVRALLDASHRVHAAPTALKESLYLDRADSGYMPIGSNTRWGSDGQPPLPVYEGVNEGYLLWGYGPPWVPEEEQLSTLEDNQLPDDATLPGFSEAVTEYTHAIDALARAMLPVYALALEQPPDFFEPKFTEPCWCLRLNHYPPPSPSPDAPLEIGIPPHADGDFCTFLLQDDLPGLYVLRSDEGHEGEWVQAPTRGEFSLLVNSGEKLQIYSNGLFPSTMHTASALESSRGRFSAPFFWSPNNDAVSRWARPSALRSPWMLTEARTRHAPGVRAAWPHSLRVTG
jgi:isopenicillin N synthase-like dioxygenase